MAEWIRKRSFEGTDNDWTVLRDGLVVGRVYFDISQNDFRAERWFWATMTIPACSGYSETMAAGLEQVRSLSTAKWSHAPHGWPAER
jgi:hypothetical protein